MFLWSYNERDQLEEVVIWTAKNARLPILWIDQLNVEYKWIIDQVSIWNFANKIIDETEEDLEKICLILKELGIVVHRPKEVDHSKYISTWDWTTDTFYSYCPRDSITVIGNTIIEAPMTMRSRFLEQFAYKDILLDCFSQWATWISAPKPQLLDVCYQRPKNQDDIILDECEPIFDAANILRAWKDIFYLHSNTGNLLWGKWLQSILWDGFKVHICENIYSGIHLDSTIALLKPWLVLLNPSRIQEDTIPEKLKKWDKIRCPDMVDTNKTHYRSLSSVWVGMNLLMVNQSLALVDMEQVELIKSLEGNWIQVCPVRLRHSRILGGWLHCISLDIKRKNNGIAEDYF